MLNLRACYLLNESISERQREAENDNQQLVDKLENMKATMDKMGGWNDNKAALMDVQGWKFMSCGHCQEKGQQASWLLIGCTRVNNQSEARSAS